jgi:hypothetical protein
MKLENQKRIEERLKWSDFYTCFIKLHNIALLPVFFLLSF